MNSSINGNLTNSKYKIDYGDNKDDPSRHFYNQGIVNLKNYQTQAKTVSGLHLINQKDDETINKNTYQKHKLENNLNSKKPLNSTNNTNFNKSTNNLGNKSLLNNKFSQGNNNKVDIHDLDIKHKKVDVKQRAKNNEFIKMEVLAEIIEKAANIGEFHSIHMINQKIYENRKTKKELDFFTEKSLKFNPNSNNYINFIEKLKQNHKNFKCMLSTILNSLFYIEENGHVTQIDLNKNNIFSFSIFNLFEKKVKLIDCLLIEKSNAVSFKEKSKNNEETVTKKIINEEHASKITDKDSQELIYNFEVHIIFLFENWNLLKFNLFDFIQVKNNNFNKKMIYELVEKYKTENLNLQCFIPFYSIEKTETKNKNGEIGKEKITKNKITNRNEGKKQLFSKSKKKSRNLQFSENLKILNLVEPDSILINVTHCSYRMLILNTSTFSIKLNFEINPIDFLNISNPIIYDSLVLFIKILINKNWTLEEKDILSKIAKDLTLKKVETKILENRLKLLAHILLTDSQCSNVVSNYDLALINQKNDEVENNNKLSIFNSKNFFEDNINFSLNEKGNCLFQALKNLYIYSYDYYLFDKEKLFNFVTMIENWNNLLQKLEEFSNFYETGDLRKIYIENPFLNKEQKNNIEDLNNPEKIYIVNDKLEKEKFKMFLLIKFFVKTFRRGIILKKLFKNMDIDSKYYLPKEEAKTLIKSFPIGLTDEDIQELFNQFPYDDHNNLIYNFLFKKEEYFLLDLISQRNSFYNEKNKKILNYLQERKNKIKEDLKEIQRQEEEKFAKNPLIYKNTINTKNKPMTEEEKEKYYDSYPLIAKINSKISDIKKPHGFFYGGHSEDRETQVILYKKKTSDKNLHEILNSKIDLINKEDFNNFTDFRILKNSSHNQNFSILNRFSGNKKIEKKSKINNFYINALNIRLYFDNIVFIKNLNILFSLNSDISSSKIFIIKIISDKDLVKKPRVKSYIKVLGFIETLSLTFPKQLYFIPQRNLLVCQVFQEFNNKEKLNISILDTLEEQEIIFRTKIIKKINNNNMELLSNTNNNNNGYYDLIFVDIYKNIFDLFQTERKWKILNYNRIRNISEKKIKLFKFFPMNKVFLIQSKNEIILINPRFQKQNISISYDMDSKNDSVFDKICKSVCENPMTLLGDQPYKIIAKFNFEKIKFLSILNLRNIEFLQKENYVDSLFVLGFKKPNYGSKKNSNQKSDNIDFTNFLFNINLISMNICLPIKKMDNPLTDLEKIEFLSKKQIERDFINIQQNIENYILEFHDLYEWQTKDKGEFLNNLICKFITKSYINVIKRKEEEKEIEMEKEKEKNKKNKDFNPEKYKVIKTPEEIITKNHIEEIINFMEKDLKLFENYNNFIKFLYNLNLVTENSTENVFESKIKLLKLEKLLKLKKQELELKLKDNPKLKYKNQDIILKSNNQSFSEMMQMNYPDFNSKLKKLIAILYYLGINPMSHFRKIKNNKIEFIKVNKESFITFLKNKRHILEKSILNIKNKIQNKLNPKQIFIKPKKSDSKNSVTLNKFSKTTNENKNMISSIDSEFKSSIFNNLNNESNIENFYPNNLMVNNLNKMKNDINCLNTLMDLVQDEYFIEDLFSINSNYLEGFLISEFEKNEISYERIYDILNSPVNSFCTYKFFNLRKSIKIKNQITFLNCTSNFALVNGDTHIAEILAGGNEANIKYTTPLESGIKKLAKAFIDKSIKIEQSFKMFDLDNEDIVDKKQFGIGLIKAKIKLNNFEIDDIFRAIDTNDTDCITEDEYYNFMELKLRQIFRELEHQREMDKEKEQRDKEQKVDSIIKIEGEHVDSTNIGTVNISSVKNETNTTNSKNNNLNITISNNFEINNISKTNEIKEMKNISNDENLKKTNNIISNLNNLDSDQDKNLINTFYKNKRYALAKLLSKNMSWSSQVQNLKPMNNLLMKDMEIYFKDQMTFYSINTTHTVKGNVEFVKACYNKFLNFLNFIGLEINLSFLYFDSLNSGVVFLDQFFLIMKKSNEKIHKQFYDENLHNKFWTQSKQFHDEHQKNKSETTIYNNLYHSQNLSQRQYGDPQERNIENLNLFVNSYDHSPSYNRANYIFSHKEIICIFCEIDLQDKKFYFTKNDYSKFQKKLVNLSLNMNKNSKKFNKNHDQMSFDLMNSGFRSEAHNPKFANNLNSYNNGFLNTKFNVHHNNDFNSNSYFIHPNYNNNFSESNLGYGLNMNHNYNTGLNYNNLNNNTIGNNFNNSLNNNLNNISNYNPNINPYSNYNLENNYNNNYHLNYHSNDNLYNHNSLNNYHVNNPNNNNNLNFYYNHGDYFNNYQLNNYDRNSFNNFQNHNFINNYENNPGYSYNNNLYFNHSNNNKNFNNIENSNYPNNYYNNFNIHNNNNNMMNSLKSDINKSIKFDLNSNIIHPFEQNQSVSTFNIDDKNPIDYKDLKGILNIEDLGKLIKKELTNEKNNKNEKIENTNKIFNENNIKLNNVKFNQILQDQIAKDKFIKAENEIIDKLESLDINYRISERVKTLYNKNKIKKLFILNYFKFSLIKFLNYLKINQDCFNVLMRVLIKLHEYSKSNSIDIFSEGDLFRVICGSYQYLPIELFFKKYSTSIYASSSKFELEIFVKKFLDIQNYKILFHDEFYETIELNLRSLLTVMKNLKIGNIEKEKKANALSVKSNISDDNNSLNENTEIQLNSGILFYFHFKIYFYYFR